MIVLTGVRKVPINRNLSTAEIDELADEALISIRTNGGKILANMLATPMDLEDLKIHHPQNFQIEPPTALKPLQLVVSGRPVSVNSKNSPGMLRFHARYQAVRVPEKLPVLLSLLCSLA